MSSYEKLDVHRPLPLTESDESEVDSHDGDGPLRTSTELRQHDQAILETEEEAEKLLAGSPTKKGRKGLFKRQDDGVEAVQISKKDRRQYTDEARREVRRARRRRKRGEESELMYEMEEGGHRDSGESSGNSSDIDRLKLKEIQSSQTAPKPRFKRLAGIHVVILIAFLGLLFGAYTASNRSAATTIATNLSNGTSTFAPTTIIISLDGFRADFLHRNITPSLNALIQAGVSPRYMLPSFPSVTFPNHFTLATGLFPEAHGIVGNTFWDPSLQAEFYYTDPERSLQPKWWDGEPIWETAELQGIRSAIHMWPGSEAHIGSVEPAYVDKFNKHEPLPNKVDRILGLIDLPGPDDPSANADTPRPQLIAAYVPDVDADGHLYGPNSTEIRKTITRADTMIGDIMQGLEERNLTNIVNLIVVSDHGMATTSTSRMIQLDNIIDMSLIKHTDGWPLYGLRPKDLAHMDALYKTLKDEAEASGNFEVYLRDKDMPERYHFSNNERIAPLWMVPKTGWAIVTRKDFDVEEAKAQGLVWHPRGLHGYDHEHPLMRAIFMAKGPAFPHAPNSEVATFQNIEVYNIVCDSLGLTARPNNGTLRLPLKTLGVHKAAPPGETPEDPSVNDMLGFPGSSPAPEPETLSSSTSAIADKAAPTRPVVHDGEDDSKEDKNMWWDWVNGKLNGIKDWASGLLNKVDNSTASEGG